MFDYIKRLAQEAALAAQGSAGKALTTVGTALNAPQLAAGGLGAQMQSAAGYGLSLLPHGTSYAETKPTDTGPNFSPLLYSPYVAPTSVPTDTGGGNPGGGNPGTPDTSGLGSDLATRAWQAARQQAGDIRSSGQSTFNTIMQSIKDFRDRSLTGFNNAGQEITNTASELLGSNARTAQEIAGDTRAKGRAAGLGDSSKFLAQTKNNANLASTQGATMAKKGEQNRANSLTLDANTSTANTNEGNAQTYLKGIGDSANAVESGGVNNFGTALNNILNYQRSIEALKTGVGSTTPTAMTPNFSGIANTLSQILGGTAPGAITTPGATDTTDQNGNPVSTTNILTSLMQPKKYNQYGQVISG